MSALADFLNNKCTEYHNELIATMNARLLSVLEDKGEEGVREFLTSGAFEKEFAADQAVAPTASKASLSRAGLALYKQERALEIQAEDATNLTDCQKQASQEWQKMSAARKKHWIDRAKSTSATKSIAKSTPPVNAQNYFKKIENCRLRHEEPHMTAEERQLAIKESWRTMSKSTKADWKERAAAEHKPQVKSRPTIMESDMDDTEEVSHNDSSETSSDIQLADDHATQPTTTTEMPTNAQAIDNDDDSDEDDDSGSELELSDDEDD